MKNLSLFCLAVALLLTTNYVSLASADDGCDKYKNSYDVTFCYCKLFIESDKELNEVYKELKALLNDSLKKKLTEVQRDWMKYRNGACEDGEGTIDVDCNYQVNKKRTEFLRDRLRECKTGNTREDMIMKKSWEE